jgi:hypothetical protein
VTIERSDRRGSRGAFQLTDRVRLEVVFSDGNELYAWPGSERFERSISELLPAHGMVSDGSYALHMRTLFLRNAAAFDEPRRKGTQVDVGFHVPAARSGYAMGTPQGTVPAALDGTVSVDADRLDMVKLVVRVDTRVGHSTEFTTYARERIGDAEFVVPQTTELVLVPGEGREARNYSRFSDYHRFTGSSTVRYGSGEAGPAAKAPAREKAAVLPRGDFVGRLEAGIGEDAAIGDLFMVADNAGAKYTGRITDMRRIGRDQWNVELTLNGRVMRRVTRFPLPAGTGLRFAAR